MGDPTNPLLKFLYYLNPLLPVWLLLTIASAVAYWYTRKHARGGGHAYTRVPAHELSGVGLHTPGTGDSGAGGGGGARGATAPTSSVFGGAVSMQSFVAHMTVNGRYNWTVALYGAWVLSCIGLWMGEAYFTEYQCKTSDRYSAELVALTGSILQWLDAQHIPYWMDFASMLAVMRHSPVPWDHDHDVSIVYPGSGSGSGGSGADSSGNALADFLNALQRADPTRTIVWDAPRDLVQVYLNPQHSGPHVDLWLWRRTHDTERYGPANDDEDERVTEERGSERGIADESLWLSSADHTLRYNPRPYYEMLPPERVWWGEGRMNVSIPRDSVKLALKSFGKTWNVPLWNRADCFHNFWHFRWAY